MRRAVLRGWLDSVSLMAGYFPIAVSFGMVSSREGFSAAEIMLVSAVVYSGAAQFVLVSMLASGGGVISVVGAVALMNLRHLFYGPSLLARLPSAARHVPRAILAWALTDEVFATAAARLRDGETGGLDDRWVMGLALGAYGSWLAGTAVGACLGQVLGTPPPAVDAALRFILPALFCALLLDMGRQGGKLVIVVSLLATVMLSRVVPAHIALAGAMVAGGIASWSLGLARRARP